MKTIKKEIDVERASKNAVQIIYCIAYMDVMTEMGCIKPRTNKKDMLEKIAAYHRLMNGYIDFEIYEDILLILGGGRAESSLFKSIYDEDFKEIKKAIADLIARGYRPGVEGVDR